MSFEQSLIISAASGVLGSLAVAIIGYFAALRKILIERKIQAIQDRYIKQGIIEPSAELSKVFETNRRNYLKAGVAFGLLRTALQDTEMKTYKEQISKIESQMDSVEINTSSKFTLFLLFSPQGQHQRLWQWVLKAEAEAQNFNLTLRSGIFTEIYGCLEKVSRNEFPLEKAEEYVSKVVDNLLKEHDKVTKNETIQGYLQQVVVLLDKQSPTTITNLLAVRSSKAFLEIMKNLEAEYERLFPDEIKQEQQVEKKELPT